MSLRDEDREPLLPPYTFYRQKSIRLPKNRPLGSLSGLPDSDCRLQNFVRASSVKERPSYGIKETRRPELYQSNDRGIRPLETHRTVSRVDDRHHAKSLSPSEYLPPRPPPRWEEPLRRYNREPLRPTYSHESDNHVALQRATPPTSHLTDGALRYLDSIRQTRQYSPSARTSSYRDTTPTRVCTPVTPFDRCSRQSSSLRGVYPRYTHQESDFLSHRAPSPSPGTRTFVSDRFLESLKSFPTSGSKSGTTTPQTLSPQLSRRCRSATREPVTPTEEKSPSFSQTLIQKLRRRSLSPSPHAFSPQESPTPSRRSRKPSGDSSENSFKRHGSLPIPRMRKAEGNWRSNSFRQSRCQAGELRGNINALNNAISSRREGEDCFALLPTPPSDSDRLRSPQASTLNSLSTIPKMKSVPKMPPVPRTHSREIQDSGSSTSSTEDTSPSHGANSLRSRSCEVDLVSNIKRDCNMAKSPIPGISWRRNRTVSSGSPDSSVSSEIGLLTQGPRTRDSASSVEENLSSAFSSDVLRLQDCFPDNNICEAEDTSKKKESYADHIKYLINNDEEYLLSIGELLRDYREMCKHTPSHIRQHFDVIFRQVGLVQAFQGFLHEAIKGSSGNLTTLAHIFRDAQFEVYSRYMVMTPSVQKELYRYSSHFDEHFPNLKRNILKPSMRINFYAMALEGLKKLATEGEKLELQKSIDFLNQLKCQANKEMTLSTVVNSPVDLRLGGDILFTGEVFCLSGGSLQKKKYSLILFENMLVIVSSKMSYFKYKVHYRSEQLYDVDSIGDSEFVLSVLAEGQLQTIYFKFKAKNTALRDQWLVELDKIIDKNRSPSGESPRSQLVSVKSFGLLMPLSLFSVFPQLRVVLEESRVPEKLPSVEEACRELILMERKFITKLTNLLHPEVIEPPQNLRVLLGNFIEQYNSKILPALEEARASGVHEMLSCMMRMLDGMDTYSDYLLVRSQLTLELDKDVRAKLYIAPVQHLEYYILWLRQMALNERYRDSAEEIRKRLSDIIMNAQIRLLTETIRNGRVDFRRSGNLIRNDALGVKTRKKGIRYGEYQALLFQKVIILTKARPPYYEYIWDIWLDQVNIGPPCTSSRSFKLEVRQGGGRDPITYEFQAANQAVKQEWVRCLQQELVCQALRIRRHSTVLHF